MLVLTIESSCDETSAAVVVDGRKVLSNAVASQIPVHRRYGGVVPELASRNHIRDIQTVIDEALQDAGVTLEEIDGIGVTSGPGLVGSLLVGIETAKALAWALDKPCVGLNHLEGHLTAVLLELDAAGSSSGMGGVAEFPYLGLIVSGGHTDLYVVRGFGDYELLGRTRDDAAGEAFDKVGKMLGLPYPAGVEIDRLAAGGDPEAIQFPRPMWTRKHFDFSFSGLKTAVATHVEAHGILEGQALRDLCASFQQAVVDVLVMKAVEAARRYDLDRLVLSGGVACNSQLRLAAQAACERHKLKLHVAPPSLCTDNAAMLGPIAEFYLSEMMEDAGDVAVGFTSFSLNATANMALGKSLRKVGPSHR